MEIDYGKLLTKIEEKKAYVKDLLMKVANAVDQGPREALGILQGFNRPSPEAELKKLVALEDAIKAIVG